MHKQLCACGYGEQVTQKVESQHINALVPALLTSQVLLNLVLKHLVDITSFSLVLLITRHRVDTFT